MTDRISRGTGSFLYRFEPCRTAALPSLVGAVVGFVLLFSPVARAQSAVGSSCASNNDCLSSHCVDGICCDPSCFGTCRSCAQVKTGQANGTCAPVLPGQQSTSGCDAAGQACSSIGCVPSSCFDGRKDGDETDVDCGGSCPGCAVASTCGANTDCVTGNCIDGTCCDPLCFGTCRSCAQAKTGLANGTCGPVSDGQQSTSGCSAAGQACSGIGCVPAGCFNGIKDGDETDVDCGGKCPGCAVAKACQTPTDCASENCIDGVCCDRSCFGTCRSCATAKTGQANGTCAPVSDGQQSTSGCNAAGQGCSSTGCVPAHCFNTVKDGDETDVDCGGSCSGCAVANTCQTPTDCASENCIDGVCCERSCVGTCHSCALQTTGQPNGTCAQVLTGQQTTNGCQAAGFVCDDLGSCVNPAAGTATPTATAPATPTTTPALTSCVGDCGGNNSVTVDEVLTMVNIALGGADVGTCAAGDPNHDNHVTVDEILTAVNNGLNGCG